MIELKLELDKIDKTKIFVSEKTGKKYLDIVVSKRQSPDNYGNTHTVYIKTKSKDEEKIYIGTGVGKFEDAAVKTETKPQETVTRTGDYNPDDLPF